MDLDHNPGQALRAPHFVQLERVDAVAARAELLAGLRAEPARIAPKHFYDPLGSTLFEAICELPEYPLARVEHAIVDAHLSAIARVAGSGRTLVDLGAGNCRKAERLFGALQPAAYVALDISTQFLRVALERLQHAHPELVVTGVGIDFTAGLALSPALLGPRPLFLYPGSSLGNFAADEALVFLKRIRDAAGPQGALLIGVDLVKPAAQLQAAYDDALGVTAAFNRNALLNVNRLLGADFDVRDWEHEARWDAAQQRIEMRLRARRAVVVGLPDGPRPFAAGAAIVTEHSHKYTVDGVERLLRAAGFGAPLAFTDADQQFAVMLATA